MKRVSIAALAGVAFLVCSVVALAWTDTSFAGTSELEWVDIPSDAFSPTGTDISGLELRGVWGSAEEDIFVVGPADTMIRFDGTNWSLASMDTEGRALNAVYGTDADNVFALADTNRTIFYSADGTNWSKRSSDNLNNALYSLWGLTPDNMIATGNVSEFWVFLYYYYAVMYVNINNSANIATATPAAMIDADLYGVWGSAENDVYAVGQSGCKRNNFGVCTTEYTSIWHFDGNSGKNWTPVAVPADDTLYAVWGSAADDIHAVGANGRLLHFDGITWSALATPTSQALRAVWGSAHDDVYAVGDAGTVLHFDGDQWSAVHDIPTAENLYGVWGSSASSVYIVGSNGTILHGATCFADADCDDGVACNGAETCGAGACFGGSSTCDAQEYCDAGRDICVECLEDAHCPEGYTCVDGTCVPIPDDPPVLGDGPFVAAGTWPVLSSSQAGPTYLKGNVGLLWTYSDDFASCAGPCRHVAEYSVAGSDTWTSLAVTDNAADGYAEVALPVTSLQNATTYAFRFAITDCAEHTTQSPTYYFRVAVTDSPPVITSGPWLAAGTWPLMPTSSSKAFVLDQDYDVVWTFSDDYAGCAGLCTHRATYRRVGVTAWTALAVSTDAEGAWYASATLPAGSLDPGTYQFCFDVRDCAGQRTASTYYYYFKVE